MAFVKIFPSVKLLWHSGTMWDKLGWLNWFWQLFCDGLSSFNPKGFHYSCMVLQFMWRKEILWHGTYLYKTLWIFTQIFSSGLLHSVSHFFFLYHSPFSSLCTVFDSILSNIDEVLSINTSANVSVFRDFKVHHKGLANLFWWNW